MALKDIFNKRKKYNGLKSYRRRKFTVNVPLFTAIFFVLAFGGILYYSHENLAPTQTYFEDSIESNLPIIFQERSGRMINELRGYNDDQYSIVSNETYTLLENERGITFLIKNMGNKFNEINYEVRDKNSLRLIERTRVTIAQENYDKKKDETRVRFAIQNIITRNTTYLLTIKINIRSKTYYYFTNIISKPNVVIDEAIEKAEDFTKRTFNEIEARDLVKYLETSINRDTKEMYNVTLQQTFEQLTFANTKMKLLSNLHFFVYQAQDYSFNIVIKFFTKSGSDDKTEFFINQDEYVLRYDGTRWYYMKFTRKTEELINLLDKTYDKSKHRFYTGVTNPNDFVKLESENKEYFAINKGKEIYTYNQKTETMTRVFSYKIKDADTYEKIYQNYDTKLLEITNDGAIIYIVYGYNQTGLNEGSMGIGIYSYSAESNLSEEKLFIPIYTTYQSMKYDLNKLCVFKNNRLIFKSYNKVFSVDIDTAEILTLAAGFEETKFAASENSKYFAFNNDEEEESKHINIYNIEEGNVKTIDAAEGENIEVVTFMNDDLFYGVFSEENIWREAGKIIGRPSHEIRVINTVTGAEDSFKEQDRYFYNFVNEKNVLRYNKYTRDGTHYTYLTNDVIVNNYSSDYVEAYPYGEELTKEKLRVGYIEIATNKNRDIRYEINSGQSKKLIEDAAIESNIGNEETLYYIYDSGELKAKLKNLSDGINEIRDNYGYVKLNDKITCYNRANKGNVSYLRQKDTILENLEGFVENIYLKENKILIMNVTGVSERDLEYYMSLNEKLAVFKHDLFQFFITGYDNNNYVLEYTNGNRILTPRDQVQEAVVYGGYVIFAQLENLE